MNGERSNGYQRGKDSDVSKRTVPDRDGKYMGGTQVLICGNLPTDPVDTTALEAEIRAFKPKPKGKLPRRILSG